ncbi:MAG: magnesium transporter [Candidatus Helarchaeota archaeon]
MDVKRIIIEALPTLILASTISIFAGFLLNSSLTLGEAIGILIITPPILSIGGDLGTTFGARITTHLHSGLIEPRFGRVRLIYINFIALFLSGLLVSIISAVVAYFLRIIIDPTGYLSLADFIIIALGAGSILYVSMLLLSLFIAFESFRRGLDPDNVVAPLISTIADLIGTSMIYLLLILRL